MSLQDLAVAAGLSVSIVSQIERGSWEDPRMSTLLALALARAVDVGRIAVDEECHGDSAANKARGRRKEK